MSTARLVTVLPVARLPVIWVALEPLALADFQRRVVIAPSWVPPADTAFTRTDTRDVPDAIFMSHKRRSLAGPCTHFGGLQW